jgi:hypothetical protein
MTGKPTHGNPNMIGNSYMANSNCGTCYPDTWCDGYRDGYYTTCMFNSGVASYRTLHNHAVNTTTDSISAGTTGHAWTSSTSPYVQMLVCQKD